MDQASIYQRMAAKWLEIAERTPSVRLKRCYMRRSLKYRTLAASSENEELADERRQRPDSGDANERQNKQ